MSSPTIDAEASEELAPAQWADPADEPTAEAESRSAPVAAAAPRPLPVGHAVPAPLRAAPAAIAPVAADGKSTAVAQVRDLGYRALAQASYQLRRLGSATLVGIVALVAAATVFLAYNMPQGAAASALQQQLAHAPTTVVAATPNGATLASLPPRGEAPNVVAKIYEEAKAAGVELPKGQYEYIPPRDGVAARYRLTFPIHASYPQIRSFLDRTLIALPAVAVEGLRIERKAVGDGNVDAEVKLAAYVRGEP